MYVLRTGFQWKALPAERFGSASAIHQKFMVWSKAGFFEDLWWAGLAEYDDCEGFAWWRHAMGGSTDFASCWCATRNLNTLSWRSITLPRPSSPCERSTYPSILFTDKSLPSARRSTTSTQCHPLWGRPGWSHRFPLIPVHSISESRVLPPDPLVQLFVVAVLADCPILEGVEVFGQFGDDVAQLQLI